MTRFASVVDRLAATIESRRGGDASTSYTAQLLGNLDRAAKKLGEEAVETVIAAAQGDRDALTAESADLIYHWLVLIAAAVSLSEGTVRNYLSSAIGKLGARNRAEALLTATDNGWV